MDNDVNSVKDPVSIHWRFIDNLHFVDDIDLIEQNCDSLQLVMNNPHEEGRRAGLKVNISKIGMGLGDGLTNKLQLN